MHNDVLVIGGGHAGLTAAITAAENGAKVLLLEASPKNMRGGNSRHTRDLRIMHHQPTKVLTDIYPAKEYWDDLVRVTNGQTNKHLAYLTIRNSANNVKWLQQHGVCFQPPLKGTLQLGRTNAFLLGGGKAMINALYHSAELLGVQIRYDSTVTMLTLDENHFVEAILENGQTIEASALIVASGGFEANREWLEKIWGKIAKNFIIRGTPYNRGLILKQLLEKGAKQVGNPKQCHAVAIDGCAPLFDGGIVSRVDCITLGIVVNKHAKRFYDEGEDLWPKRYAIWGHLVAQQPDQIAYVIIDAKSEKMFIPSAFPPKTANTLLELAQKIAIDPDALLKTVHEYNASIQPGTFNHTKLDNCHTQNLAINKTHWARTIDTPPFKAYLLRPGITFTYLGVTVNDKAQIIMADDQPSKNIFAAGEIMAGNVLAEGYLAGTGLTIGAVFGRIAGKEAAQYATN